MKPPLETLAQNEDFKICYQSGKSNRLVICLSGIGSKRSEMPPFEFIGSASDQGSNHLLMVSETRRTWMNDEAFSSVLITEIEKIVQRHAISDIVTLGNSMGGFMALVLPQLTKVDCAIAFSPQYSMHPRHVPEENRWLHWRSRFPGYVHDTIGSLDPERCQYFIFHGDAPEEEIHWRRFPTDSRLHHLIFKDTNHQLVTALKKREALPRTVKLAINRKPRKLRLYLQQHFEVSYRGRSRIPQTETSDRTKSKKHPEK